MGGRVAMTLGCKFQDRIDGIISLDSAPVDESQNTTFYPEAYKLVTLLNKMNKQNLSKKEGLKMLKEHSGNRPELVHLLTSNLDEKS